MRWSIAWSSRCGRCVAAIVNASEKNEMSGWLSSAWYEFCRCHIMAGLTLGFSLRFEGGRNIPANGPALLIANHESFLDPIAVGLTTTRQLCYLARKTLFTPGFGWF